ncbi:hypothetical protein ABZV75_10360 [Streptomyces flaveolus]|uniref:hypothetical protein n=1 Tax=Streptomyces flaveolus TaxID=67297 RepID=UPI0033BE4E0F
MRLDLLHFARRVVAYRHWRLLKERVATELNDQGRDPAVKETLAFERAIRAACDPILDSFRSEFRAQVTELQDGLGLYAAIVRLSQRQFDVSVPQFALGLSIKRTALVMGVREATVRSTRRAAGRGGPAAEENADPWSRAAAPGAPGGGREAQVVYGLLVCAPATPGWPNPRASAAVLGPARRRRGRVRGGVGVTAGACRRWAGRARLVCRHRSRRRVRRLPG